MVQRFLQLGARHGGGVQCLHRAKAAVDGFRVHQRLLDPSAQQTLAHGGFGLVQHPQQRSFFLAPAHGFGQFQIGAGHRRQPHILRIGVVLHRADALHTVLLRFVQVVDHRRHGIRHQGVGFVVQRFAPVFAELVGHRCLHDAVLIAGILAQLHKGVCVLLDVGGHVLEIQHRGADQNLAGHIAAQLGDDGSADFFGIQLGGVGLARGNIGKADARAPAPAGALAVHAAQVVVLVLRQHTAFNDGAGGHHTDDIPLDQPLCLRRVLHLLADGDLVALGDQPRHIGFVGVKGYAAHGGALLLAAAFARKSQFQLAGGCQGIVIEHLIEIPHTVEKNFVGMLFFNFKILLHHGRYGLLGHVSHSCTL